MQELRDDEDITDVHDAELAGAIRERRHLVEERGPDRLRPEVRPTTVACADVGRDPEHDRLRAGDPGERITKAGVDLARVVRAVQALLQALLLGSSRRHQVEATTSGTKE